MAQAATHPLLSLPDDEIIQKLREMNHKEILKFSLISERCKKLITSVGIKAAYFHVAIGSDIWISIDTETQSPNSINFYYYREPDVYWGMGAYGLRKRLTETQSILAEVSHHRGATRDPIYELKKSDYTMKKWLDHLQQIFNHRKIDNIWFRENSSQFDIDDIKEVFVTTSGVWIGDTGCYAFNQMIFEKFCSIEKIWIKPYNFPNFKIPEKILIQNFTDLSIGDGFAITSMTLDELLLINSKVVRIESCKMPAKRFNKFIKLWQNGSNPHLEYFSIDYPRGDIWDVHHGPDSDVDERNVKKGIEHSVIPTNRRRMFKVAGTERPHPISGGIDIHRMDGVRATILLRTFPVPYWRMYVWFDHCVVES